MSRHHYFETEALKKLSKASLQYTNIISIVLLWHLNFNNAIEVYAYASKIGSAHAMERATRQI